MAELLGAAMAQEGVCMLGVPEICNYSPDHFLEHSQMLALLTLGVLLVSLCLGAVLHRLKWDAVPESLVIVMLGICFGFILVYSPLAGHSGILDVRFVRLLFAGALNLFALPIIIFESGWSLRIRDFVSQFGYIMFFAIIGTIVSVLVVAQLLMWTSEYHVVKDWRLALTFAALISSVDPVSTLATFGHLNVDPLLFILVFGESQINDAVAITLFRSLNTTETYSALPLLRTMLTVFCGSVGLGVVIAFALILIFRFTRMGHAPAHAVLMIFASCFFTFTAGELAGFSGIIAVLFNSILMGSYAGVHLSNESMALASFLLKQMSSLADTLIFLFSGVVGVYVVAKHGQGMKLGLMLCGICLVARFAAVVPLGLLSNLIKSIVGRHLPKEREHMISWKHLIMMWHSGLRGGVSLVLVMELSGSWVDHEVKTSLTNATFVMVVVYLLVFGSTTALMLRCLGLPIGDEVDPDSTLYSDGDKDGYAWRVMLCARQNFMLPILVGRSILEEHERACAGGEGVGGVAGNAVSDALREADAVEHSVDFGAPQRPALTRRNSAGIRSSARASILFDLFGSTDPTHMNSKSDVIGDMRSSAVFGNSSTSLDRNGGAGVLGSRRGGSRTFPTLHSSGSALSSCKTPTEDSDSSSDGGSDDEEETSSGGEQPRR